MSYVFKTTLSCYSLTLHVAKQYLPLVVIAHRPQRYTFIVTWVEEDDGFQRGVLVVIDLNVLEGLNQLVQHAKSHPRELRFQTVPLDHAAVAW